MPKSKPSRRPFKTLESEYAAARRKYRVAEDALDDHGIVYYAARMKALGKKLATLDAKTTTKPYPPIFYDEKNKK